MAQHTSRFPAPKLPWLRWLAVLPTLWLLWGPARSADAPAYVKKATWQETLIAGREALTRQERAAGKGLPFPAFGESDFTVTAWVRTTAGGTILSRSSPTGVWACNGKCFFIHQGRLGYDVGCIGVFSARTPIADGNWHHVALAYSDADRAVEFSVDGRPDGRASVKGNAELPDDIVRVGTAAPNFAAPNGFTGDIDEVRVYNRRLSPAEIEGAYRQAPEAPAAGCVAWWTFDKDASDASGNHHDGKLQGATLADGRFGKAAHFDGKSGVAFANDDAGTARADLWQQTARDFPDARREMLREQEDHIWEQDWNPGDLRALAGRYAAASARVPALRAQAEKLAAGVRDLAGLQAVRAIYHRSRGVDEVVAGLRALDPAALRLAIEDLTRTYGARYPRGPQFLAQLDRLAKDLPALQEKAAQGDAAALKSAAELVALRRDALLANPLLDFDRLLLVRRRADRMGLPQNWESNSSIPMAGYDNEIQVLSPVSPDGRRSTLFKPEGGRFVGDLELSFDAGRLLFTMPGDNGRWQIQEIRTDGSGLRQLPLIHEPDVDNYDACYLPNGNILFTSTATFTGVPCVTGASHVSNLYSLDPKGKIRRLTFEQDHDWCPRVLNDGRVLYLRWEYSDIPHYVARILFHMNPDGTDQKEYYGSNSYWPNAMFYARQVPGSTTKFVAIVGGHHDVPRMGELVLFDTTRGRHEADGAVQRIPGRGKKVEPIIRDGLVGASWPKFLHPWPLSDKYFLVSAKPSPSANWGIYLVDAFDNMLLLQEEPGYALLEPIPLKKRPVPPVIPDRTEPGRKDALVYMADVYAGPGLKGVPRGTVKKLRLFTYQFAYHGMGGQVNRVGLDGPWDVKRIMGTVPVEADGSAYFRVPANTPISVQPLDGEGKALQLMRSWMTAMPGEVLSCVGCHEPQNTTPLKHTSLALTRAPSEIASWYGPTRGFSFRREVQPVLDRYCVSCHQPGKSAPDFRDLPDVHPQARDAGYNNGTHFPPSYIALRSFVRTPTMESDMHILEPCEYHADTTRLVRLLEKGHHGVQLNAEAWDRLVTWIDLNTPAHGTWHEIVGTEKVDHQRDRRREMNIRYANLDEDPEAIPETKAFAGEPGGPVVGSSSGSARPGGRPPYQAEPAQFRPAALGNAAGPFTVDLGGSVKLEMVPVPAGEFTMGDAAGCPDEAPAGTVRIARPFWMGRLEITNEQYARFDPAHDSRLESGDFLQFSVEERGYPVDAPRQPVCRVSWREAMAFCRWLSQQTGRRFTLPTEAQWEYACRAGTTTPLWYGQPDADFSPFANLADASLRAVDTFAPWSLPSGAVQPWRPAIESVKDGFRVSAPAGSFRPNPWGLCDMAGNVAEWTRSDYRPYPYVDNDGRNAGGDTGKKVVRGGSWYDRPAEARSAYRAAYPAWQRVYDVGFRVVCEEGPAPAVAAK